MHHHRLQDMEEDLMAGFIDKMVRAAKLDPTSSIGARAQKAAGSL